MASSKNSKQLVLTQERVEECIKLLDKALALIDDGESAMTALDRKRQIKLRKGGEKYIPTIATLATAYGLTQTKFSVEGMSSAIETAQILVPLEKCLAVITKKVADSSFRAESLSWETATFLYGMLRQLARKDANVAEALAPMQDFFSYRHPSVKAEKAAAKKASASKATPVVTTDVAKETPVSANATPVASDRA